MSGDAIRIVPYDPAWRAVYAAAREEILGVMPIRPLLVEHIGSTAVPGLAAKPVIDIVVLVAEMGPAHAAMPGLEQIGYEFRPEVSNAMRLFLRRRAAGGERTHHLHIHTDQADVSRHILFRDRLRADADTRQAYEALKRDLANRHAGDREAYAKGKDGFVDAVVLAAGGPERRPFWKG